MERAEGLARESGLLLVVGSSLQVWPVAGLPETTVRAGGALAILNLEATPVDGRAVVVVRGPSAPVLDEVARTLDPRVPNA
jgi:NAD-dependent deacetylase